MDNSPQANHNRYSLLSRVKRQHEPGPMRPRLVSVIKFDDKPLPKSKVRLQWEAYAGMGETMLNDLSPDDKKAANELLEEGALVPTITYQANPYEEVILIQHFDDVRWGKTYDNQTIIFDLSHTADNDEIIHPDDTHKAAIAMLRAREEYTKTALGTPLTIKGTKITPIITDGEAIKLMERQAQFTQAQP